MVHKEYYDAVEKSFGAKVHKNSIHWTRPDSYHMLWQIWPLFTWSKWNMGEIRSRFFYFYFFLNSSLCKPFSIKWVYLMLCAWRNFQKTLVAYLHMINETLSHKFHPHSILNGQVTVKWLMCLMLKVFLSVSNMETVRHSNFGSKSVLQNF